MLAIATGTRADWGLLKPLADQLLQKGERIDVLATNMHLDPRYGNTIEEIRADGYEPTAIPATGSPTAITAAALLGFSKHFSQNQYDAVIILGDRFEMLGVASAALLCHVPIVHIAGGTVSEGAFDDAIRNSITQMASLHFVETENCRFRVVAMGKNEEDVITTGALGVYNFLRGESASKEELEEFIGMKLSDNTLLVTLHAATLSPVAPEKQMQHLTDALTRVLSADKETLNNHPELKECKIIFTYPNNDSHAPAMIDLIENFKSKFTERVAAVPSLGRRRYMAALKYCRAVIGNSSSGIVEVPSAGIPTLDIGIRQKGRERSDAVIHCDDSPTDIYAGILKVLSKPVIQLAQTAPNPYYKENTPMLMAEAIVNHKKSF